MKTKHPVTVDYSVPFGGGPSRRNITIPAGARVKVVDGGPVRGNCLVVDDVALLISLTGNTHDPKYRYCYLPDGVEVEG